MSWSVGAIGKSQAVRAEIANQFTKNPCVEPEESIRQEVAKTIDAALAAQDPAFAVKVSASGSQSFKDWNAKTGVSSNLVIAVEPLYNFVE
jgi:hypothetical protein